MNENGKEPRAGHGGGNGMKKSVTDVVKYVVLVAALVSMLFGIVRGEPKVVLRKATHICMECIGIG